MTHAPGRTAPAAFTDMSTPGSERSGTTMSVSVKQGGHTSSTIPDEETNVTTTNIYIASPEGANGRNVVAYGVLKALTTKFKTAVFRPAVSNHDHFTPILLNAPTPASASRYPPDRTFTRCARTRKAPAATSSRRSTTR